MHKDRENFSNMREFSIKYYNSCYISIDKCTNNYGMGSNRKL